MSRPNFFNSHVVYHDNSKEYNIDARGRDLASVMHEIDADEAKPKTETEDVEPVDTSFFCVDRFTSDIIEKNIRQTIHLSSSKADACRRLMSLETQGYIVLSNVGDDRKAELINPFSTPKFIFNGQDFKQARNNPPKKK